MNVTESSKQQSNNVHKCGRKFSYACIYDADYCHTYIPQKYKEVVRSSGYYNLRTNEYTFGYIIVASTHKSI